MYACSVHVYRHMFGLYLLCICVLDAGNLAVLEDVVTRKMRKRTTHASAALFYYVTFFTILSSLTRMQFRLPDVKAKLDDFV